MRFLIVNRTPWEKSRLQASIDRDDLANCLKESEAMIFDLDNKSYFNPEENKWVEIEVKS